MAIEAYPLCWPDGWKRTPSHRLSYSKFRTGFGAAREFLFDEIRRMGGTRQILSTNVPLRNDGMPRANMPEPADRGVAVYFDYHKKSMVFACDKYINVRDNIYAIAKTIEALRGIERWGASDMMERAFTGFAALPETTTTPWRKVLGFTDSDGRCNRAISLEEVKVRYREMVRTAHPDAGGTPEEFRQITEARDQALVELQAAS